MADKAELVINARAVLGEGPHWNDADGKLYWVDIEGRQLRSYDPATGKEQTVTLEQRIGAAVPDAAGGWILALQQGIYRYDGSNPDQLEQLAEVEPELPGNRLNDAKCDSAGRLWFGSMSMGSEQSAGSLYVMERDGNVRQVLSGVGISNGLAWDDRLGRMYYIDSVTRAVDALDFDPDSGKADNRRAIIHLPEGNDVPDGMTIDREGMLWVAQWGGSCVSRWNPHTGEQIGRVEVPALNVTSCTFGGEALDELYITTARNGMSEEELERWPLTGGLFRFKPGVQGMAANIYRSLS
ncbi:MULTISPECIES: SMP-30/gluconolactonase/LRE family protein [unclassified Paenibacillus]|uniref:SMP-30/gluconolactonase/LRE family protein n=1 Tax=unclassified Paenibacillus TaxID=185978 RepID=UPI002406BC92|nr:MULTISPECIES: SMP-30/gluconolactonase/LRE family protein [unclassified Paenibacillus]MDF9844840.1 sugar lactone lactonase YvrE [Paenibacillus sp. PastF-2]MDF9851441.1 sugar lactone lactonase YvrE [Paenibacillus sp. PastM-2]MDF9858029.1 sugar lactone lactonase YvrE [Paenibacillus sp. PastF-1]MDH6483297.1 sugar lactone lactonase YvrE [Paenibacillus sp. PastH-2]MDH6510706.1 sugar lactone lactonase YvrE [Paenibacillus sp. PastM-3]